MKQRNLFNPLWLLCALCLFPAIAFAEETGTPAAKVNAEDVTFFENRVRPLLVEKCQPCHNDKSQSGSIRLDSLAEMLRGNSGGPTVVPGDPEKSPLIHVIRYDGKVKMPPSGKLKTEEIAALSEWIKRGAPWPGGAKGKAGTVKKAPADPESIKEAKRTFWSLRPVTNPAPAKVKSAAWIRNPIDSFVLAKLESKGLQPSTPADRRALLRRVTFDLTGLPPTPEEVRAFLNDKSANAYEKVVDRLLANPRYGERWGRHWLDVARYADTKGYNFVSDAVFHYAYTYRDWVIRVFNEDLPYDQFLIQQLAADQLDLGDDKRPLAALGFLTLGRRFLNDPVLINDDRIDTTLRGMQALTVACARCHDHKFDPISQKDYYALYGIFASTNEPDPLPPISEKAIREPYLAYITRVKAQEHTRDETIQAQVRRLRGIMNSTPDKLSKAVRDTLQSFREGEMPNADHLKRLEPLFEPAPMSVIKTAREQLVSLQKSPPKTPEFAQALQEGAPFDPYVFIRGNPNNPGPHIPRRFLTVLAKDEPQSFTKGSGRLELARAIASKDNPLTARVMVNRIWLHHFGEGLVRTPSDFGTRGETPSHPELLDWLAASFMENGWSIKKIQRTILLSSTYRQSVGENPKAAKLDPENRLLWRQVRQRLDLEGLRDSLLFVSGQMDANMGGPSVELTTAPYAKRRTVYGFIERQNLPGLFRTFDFASPDISNARRYNTTIPQQALFMMNSPFVMEQAKTLAARVDAETGKIPPSSPKTVANATSQKGAKQKRNAKTLPVDGRIRALYWHLYGREPEPDEAALGTAYLQQSAKAKSPSQAELPIWSYGYGGVEAQTGKVTFTPLPHFTGEAWQGGATLPDSKLSWLMLNKEGGHPGPLPNQAVIRRWTAPYDAVISISGVLDHPEDKGDGVRGRVISSQSGELGSWQVFHSKTETSIESVSVKKGEMLDFVVDCRGSIDYDGFAWAPTLQAAVEGGPRTASLQHNKPKQRLWSAKAEFSGPQKAALPPLSAWEKYVHTLLMTNEFCFVD